MTTAPRQREYLRYYHYGVILLLGLAHVGVLVMAWYGAWAWAGFGFLLVALVLTHGTFYPHSRLFGAAVRSFPNNERTVILTIDDGPCADTDEILGILAEHRARAVFFLIGERALQRPQDVQRILAAGHLIGNHTQTHPAYGYWSYPPWMQGREIGQCQETLSAISGIKPKLFRAPVGMRNPFCNLVAAGFSLEVIGWCARGFDGVDRPMEKIIATIRRGLRPGGIVLLHQGLPHSPTVVRRTLEMLEEERWGTTLPQAWLSDAPSAGTPPTSC